MLDDDETVAVLESLAIGRPIALELTPLQAFTVIGNLQLALRHPKNLGESADLARRVAGLLISGLPEPARSLATKGWDPAFDVRRR